ncbi:hypothetical protein PTSG_08980 [Salpingoeca rosetta]|uniref:Sulfotransferase domain-containing protein n=1 Tax=Salpingoeca rosetta (strain ATCC 50818 / BSB-021) TaxID=946362 RepID=F2ULV3_SALR5|nr:uncharacterized protein PTSG_08980 [Salpingoeca rosetta]EGD78102.1 hypothetical protein PTSG_08980 [Salpingoeca rosetta]|eukprot:XP_004989778.1 hypothetical protein PTSG_08980 [Salpingoeca rosetta]
MSMMDGGVLYPSFITQKGVNELKDADIVTEDDLFILTFPKCGTTVTQQIVHLLNHEGEQPDHHMMAGVPWLEASYCNGTYTLEGLKERKLRCFKSHASPHLFPGDWRKPKMIFVTRNPKDTMVSMYHHMKNKKTWSFAGSWDDFFYNKIMQNTIESNNFFDWHLPWWERYKSGQVPRALWLHYEDIIADMPGSVRKIADFMGKDVSDETVAEVARMSTLDSMKKNPLADCKWITASEHATEQGDAQHLRRGGKGNWKDVFTVRQNEIFTRYCDERLKGTGLTYDYGE